MAEQQDKPKADPDTPAAEEPKGKDQKRARQSAAPFCPYHKKTRCKANRSDVFFTRYYCPEEGCTFSVKQPRPEMPSRLHAQQDDHSAR